MSRDAAFVEYALFAFLEDVLELEQLYPVIVMTSEELKAVLNIPERLRPERISKIRTLCAAQEIGYAVIGNDHIFFKGLSPRRFERGELDSFVRSVDEFEDVYGSKKAEDMYRLGAYHGIFTNPDKVRQVRGGKPKRGNKKEQIGSE
ncbi:MAG: hypothetical protein AB7O56_08455 [Bauldia sp.]